MSLRILLHSYRMIANNPSEVFRIAFMPWIATIILLFVSSLVRFGVLLPQASDIAGNPMSSIGTFLISLVSIIGFLCIYLWLIVGWHRFILLGEGPNRFFPNWHGDKNLAYFLCCLMIALTLIIPMIISGFIIGSIGVHGGVAILVIVSFGLNLFVSFIVMRISLILPAAAIGERMKISESWHATDGQSMTIFKLALTLAIMFTVVGTFINAMAGNTFGVLFGQLINGLFGLYSVSIITTLYGLIIEKREL